MAYFFSRYRGKNGREKCFTQGRKGLRVSQVNSWKRRVLLLRISTIAIAVTSVLSLAVMLITYFGDNVGNYVVGATRLDNNYALSLSLSSDKTQTGSEFLSAPGVKNLDNITYGNIGNFALSDGEKDSGIFANTQGGSHNLYRGSRGLYFAYTFYLRNESVEDVSYTMEVFLKSSFLGLDEAIRVMVIKDGEIAGIYAKASADGSPEDHTDLEEGYRYTTKPFIDSSVIAAETFTLAKDAQSCFTVIMWLEGEDEQCVDAVKGGSVKLSMDFTLIPKK